MALQNIRSNTASKRPLASGLSDGQIAVNTNETSPGLFFKGADGAVLKVGPVHIGNTAPNSSPATGGSTGNSVGEQWLDTSNSGFVFKIWDGTDWRSETGQFVDVAGDTMTGDLTISSADLVMDDGEIIAASGAEATPSITFEGDLDTGFHKPAADKLAISTGGTSRVIIDDSGRVGIGTTAPDELLHIEGNVAEFKGTNTNPIDVTAGTEQIFKFGIEGQKNNVYGPAGSIIFRQDNSSWSSAESNFKPTRIELCTQDGTTTDTSETPRLVVDQNGNIGIGTTDPGATLHVNSAGQSTSNIDTTTSIQQIISDSNTAVGSGGSIVFAANNANWSFAAIKGLVSSGGGNSRGDLAFSVRTNTTDSTLSEAMRITSAGLVGIGTTAPVSLLNVKSPLFNTAETVASFGNSSISDGLEIITNGNLDWGFNAKNSRNLTFSTNQTERLRITSGGLVGIGTTVDPVEKLEVNGTIKATDINFTGLATYADDAAAGTGGLVTGDVYKPSTGALRIKV